jgi:hypothetical protein
VTTAVGRGRGKEVQKTRISTLVGPGGLKEMREGGQENFQLEKRCSRKKSSLLGWDSVGLWEGSVRFP